ncbi:hypothetical protein ACG7TL_008775 [Trametes sanguinea]
MIYLWVSFLLPDEDETCARKLTTRIGSDSVHKAAYPDRYPVKPKAKVLYPVLNGIEERYGPTKVHLQVYDDAAHTLPVLFAFTTPGKYCFRAMATFIKYITGDAPYL